MNLPEPTGFASMQVHHSLKTPHKCTEIIWHWNTQETAWSNLHCNQCMVPFIHSYMHSFILLYQLRSSHNANIL